MQSSSRRSRRPTVSLTETGLSAHRQFLVQLSLVSAIFFLGSLCSTCWAFVPNTVVRHLNSLPPLQHLHPEPRSSWTRRIKGTNDVTPALVSFALFATLDETESKSKSTKNDDDDNINDNSMNAEIIETSKVVDCEQANGNQEQVVASTSKQPAPSPPPCLDTTSLNNALHNFAKSSQQQSNNKYTNTKTNTMINKKKYNNIKNIMNQSKAQKAQDLLFQCEEWYSTHSQMGYTIVGKGDKINNADKNHDDSNDSDSDDDNMVIVGPVPDAYSYSFVIDAWAKIGNSKRTMELLRHMYALDKEERKHENNSSKLQQQQNNRNIKPNTITYNSVINSLCSSIQQGRISNTTMIESTPLQAQALLEEMKQHVIQQTNLHCTPDTTTYNTVLKVWSHSVRKDSGYHSEELLNEMWFYHHQYEQFFNTKKINSDSDSDGNNYIHDGEKKPELLLNITPDQFSYSTTITSWARSSLKNKSTSAKRAEKLLEQMEEYRSNGYLYLSPTTYCGNAVLNAWSKIATNNKVNGAAYRAEQILKRMETLSNNDDRHELCPNTISYNTVISAYARSGEVGSERRAERILRRMDRLSSQQREEKQKNDDHDGDAANSNNEKVQDDNDDEHEKRCSCKPDLISYNTVINAWSRSKDPDAPKRAEAILNHMESQYQNGLSSIRPDVVTYTSCIAAWARSKATITPNMAQQAQHILGKMDEAYRAGNHSVKPTVLSYNTVCNAWAKSRDKDAANKVLSILSQMESMHTNGQQYVKPDIFTYTTCIDALAKDGTKGSAEKALELLNTIERRYNDTLDSDIKPNVRTYTSVINAISRSKLGPEYAETLLTRMETLGKKNNDKDLKIDVVCFNAVLNAWGWSSEPGKARRANKIYQKMQNLYESGENRDAKPDLITLNSLLNACAFSNAVDEEESAEAVNIAVKAYEKYQSEAPLYGIPNHLTYGNMLMIFNKMLPNNELQDELMRNLFYSCCEKGHLSGFVVSQLQNGFSKNALKELFGKAAVNDGKSIVIDKRKVPRNWSR
jgi:hypothetical protein